MPPRVVLSTKNLGAWENLGCAPPSFLLNSEGSLKLHAHFLTERRIAAGVSLRVGVSQTKRLPVSVVEASLIELGPSTVHRDVSIFQRCGGVER